MHTDQTTGFHLRANLMEYFHGVVEEHETQTNSGEIFFLLHIVS